MFEKGDWQAAKISGCVTISAHYVLLTFEVAKQLVVRIVVGPVTTWQRDYITN